MNKKRKKRKKEEEEEEEEEEEDEEEEVEQEEEEEEEEELEVFEHIIKGKTYFITSEKDGEIYDCDENGDIGDEVGKFTGNIKDKKVKYKFYKK